MVYQKGRVFHTQCFTDHGNSFAPVDSELARISARTRIELVQLKNLKARAELEKQAKQTKPAKIKKSIKKMKKKRKVIKRRKKAKKRRR